MGVVFFALVLKIELRLEIYKYNSANHFPSQVDLQTHYTVLDISEFYEDLDGN